MSRVRAREPEIAAGSNAHSTSKTSVFSTLGEAGGCATVVFLNARYLDPQLGRFLSVDPIVALTRDAYGYGGNNPIKYSDPTGLEKGANGEAHGQCYTQDNCRPNAAGVDSWDNSRDFGDSNWLSAFNKANGDLTKMPHNGMGGGWPRNVNPPSTELVSAAPGLGDAIDGVDCLGGSGWSCIAAVLPGVGGRTLARILGGVGEPSAKLLARNLENAGSVRPDGTAAHHIVAGKASRAADAKRMLEDWGIDINSAENGVYLPATSKSPNAHDAAVHSKVHTNAYYNAVTEALRGAGSREEAVAVLADIRASLLSGGFP